MCVLGLVENSDLIVGLTETRYGLNGVLIEDFGEIGLIGITIEITDVHENVLNEVEHRCLFALACAARRRMPFLDERKTQFANGILEIVRMNHVL